MLYFKEGSSTMAEIWVFAETTQALSELIAGGRTLNMKVVALVIGTDEDVQAAIYSGAEEVLYLEKPTDGMIIEDYVETFVALLQERTPTGLLLSATRSCKVIAGRLAAQLGASVITNISTLTVEDGKFVATHLLFGGGAVRKERALSEIAIVTVGSGIFQGEPPDQSRSGKITRVPFVESSWRITVREIRPKPPSSFDLAAAKRVVGVGRGLKDQDDLKMIEKLAESLEAEIGCTRPVAEVAGWLPREHYIGMSGVVIKPDLYLALGISGQIQHMIGVNRAQVIVAVNEDKNAPIFSQADYGIVGDLYSVVPALVHALQEQR
jgi:electron transfer flavoprotein alpha subunit